jgi:hypothetical protein
MLQALIRPIAPNYRIVLFVESFSDIWCGIAQFRARRFSDLGPLLRGAYFGLEPEKDPGGNAEVFGILARTAHVEEVVGASREKDKKDEEDPRTQKRQARRCTPQDHSAVCETH